MIDIQTGEKVIVHIDKVWGPYISVSSLDQAMDITDIFSDCFILYWPPSSWALKDSGEGVFYFGSLADPIKLQSLLDKVITDPPNDLSNHEQSNVELPAHKPNVAAVNIHYNDGTLFYMTATNVKEWELDPLAANGIAAKRFDNASDRSKERRPPTQDELEWYRNIS